MDRSRSVTKLVVEMPATWNAKLFEAEIHGNPEIHGFPGSWSWLVGWTFYLPFSDHLQTSPDISTRIHKYQKDIQAHLFKSAQNHTDHYKSEQIRNLPLVSTSLHSYRHISIHTGGGNGLFGENVAWRRT